MVRILITDDHAVLRSGLRLLLEREDDFQVAGEATTAEEALEFVGSDGADLVLLDIEMPGMGGLDGAAEMRRRHPDLGILMLSMHGEADDVRRAFAAGASGYVLKTAADEQLVQAVRAVAMGERYLHPALGAVLAQPDGPRGPVDDLSPREREVLRLAARGMSNAEIAQELFVTEQTVKFHLSNTYRKLGAHNRTEASHRAAQAGILG